MALFKFTDIPKFALSSSQFKTPLPLFDIKTLRSKKSVNYLVKNAGVWMELAVIFRAQRVVRETSGFFNRFKIPREVYSIGAHGRNSTAWRSVNIRKHFR